MATFENGTIIFVGEVQTRMTSKGEWRSLQVVVEHPAGEGRLKKVALTANNDKIADVQKFKEGDKVRVGYDVRAREWQGRWFNDVELFYIGFPAPEQAQQTSAAPAAPVAPVTPEEVQADLPF